LYNKLEPIVLGHYLWVDSCCWGTRSTLLAYYFKDKQRPTGEPSRNFLIMQTKRDQHIVNLKFSWRIVVILWIFSLQFLIGYCIIFFMRSYFSVMKAFWTQFLLFLYSINKSSLYHPKNISGSILFPHQSPLKGHWHNL